MNFATQKKFALKAGLLDNLETLVEEFYPPHLIHAAEQEIRVGNKGSLVIHRDGGWYSFEHEEGGDILSFIMHEGEMSFADALEWAEDFLRSCNGILQTTEESQSSDAIGKIDKTGIAQSIWESGVSIKGTVAEKYLRTRRIHSVLPHAHTALRFVPRLKHSSGTHHPALIAKATTRENAFAGIFRTFLAPNGKSKAFVTPNKMRLGVSDGAAIRLSAGHPTEVLICEGLEDALSIQQTLPEMAVWCGMGAAMRSILLPESVRSVIIAADNDEAGEKHSYALAKRLRLQGRHVKICRPLQHKDFNDVLRAGA
jgi:DNA primase